MAKRILIVDDDSAILEVTKIILQEEGYEVDSIADAGVIKTTLKKEVPDLIILDYWLPGFNTEAIINDLKTRKETKRTPILMISAYQISEADVLKIGADGFIQKPFDINDLVRKVDKFVGNSEI